MRSGDTCPQCGKGRMKVITSRSVNDGKSQQRWYKCEACGKSAKAIVPRSTVWLRQILSKNDSTSVESSSR